MDRMESGEHSCDMLLTGSSPIDVREKPSKDLQLRELKCIEEQELQGLEEGKLVNIAEDKWAPYEHHFDELMRIYEGRDGYQWKNQGSTKECQQFTCLPEDRPVIILKASTVIRAPAQTLIDCSIDFETRMAWDKTIYDFKVYSTNEDRSISKVGYTFKSPVMIIADRDFYLHQFVRWDYPTKGSVSIFCVSLPPADECPEVPKKQRSHVYLLGFIITPHVDPTSGEEHCTMFVCNNIDPCGLIPKWAVNFGAKSVLPDWLRQFERGCIKHYEMTKESKINQA